MAGVVYHKHRVCIEANVLWQSGIITRSNYDAMVKRRRLTVVRRGGGADTPALVSWNDFPEHLRAEVKSALGGDPRDLAQRNILTEYLEYDASAEVFFSGYRRADGDFLPSETVEKYIANAGVLNAIGRYLETVSHRRSPAGSQGLWETLSDSAVRVDRSDWPHDLPVHWQRLRSKYVRYVEEGYSSLVHKGFSNRSAARVKEDIQTAVLQKLLSNNRNLDNGQVSELYNLVASASGWKTISASTVGVWRERFSLEASPGRLGIGSMMNGKLMQHRRSRPSTPMNMWSMDGWVAELLYSDSHEGRSTYTNRLTVVVAIDVFGNYPVGYAIGSHETPELISLCLRNAINHVEELFGSRYRPHQLQSDRYQIKKLTPVYEAVAKYVTPARAHNAKAKPVEPFFKDVNRYCQLHYANWSGFGVTSQKERQPNLTEWLKSNRHRIPDRSGCESQLHALIADLRRQGREAYLDGWRQVPESGRLVMSEEDYLYYFGDVRRNRRGEIITNTLQGDGVTASIGGEEHTYDCFDLSFRRHAGEKWILHCCPESPERVLAVNAEGSLRYLLEKKYVQPMALADRQPGDSEALKRVNDFNQSAIEYLTSFNCRRDEIIEKYLDDLPALNDTLQKFCITDSRGQHKDNLSASRALQAARQLEGRQARSAKKKASAARQDFADEHARYIDEKVDMGKYCEL
ncbi:MAG: hypothetical protein LBF81_07590 [Prevotellaceae bacterium]|jgi:hypothetical protein|nr:hypothetical protein [Prevotellaceae bacterium]